MMSLYFSNKHTINNKKEKVIILGQLAKYKTCKRRRNHNFREAIQVYGRGCFISWWMSDQFTALVIMAQRGGSWVVMVVVGGLIGYWSVRWLCYRGFGRRGVLGQLREKARFVDFDVEELLVSRGG